ncbi:MAG: pyocin activator PrtN family protein [Pseudomonas sp.]|nr:pyocin activator PrtN family protein [Pseudomonas sp.]
MIMTSPARPQEGRGEPGTLELLRLRYRCNYIPVETLMENHLTQYSSTKTLLRAIEQGRLQLQVDQLGAGRKAPRIVYLRHLAEFLDRAELEATEVA